MLSNCKDCKFYSNSGKIIACAVNPRYLEMFNLMVSKITYETLSQYNTILDCSDFQISEELQEQTVNLNLTIREWKQIISSRSQSNLSEKIIVQIRQALNIAEVESSGTDDIPF